MNLTKLCYTLIFSSILWACVNENNAEDIPKFQPNWESLSNYKVPRWFNDAKFGILIHWGVYSVPAYYSEWYPRLMYQDSIRWHQTDPRKSTPGSSPVYLHHTHTYGHPSEFGYKDFIPMFKGEKFNAKDWVELFKKAGAKYVIPVAEHHDGFAMYKSNVTRWNSFNMGPKIDVAKQIKEAAVDAGLSFGLSSHFAFNWDYYDHSKKFDTSNPELNDLYGLPHERYAPVSSSFLELWWQRVKDIIDNYQPEILCFDFYIDRPEFTSYHRKLAAYYYNKGIETKLKVVLQTKNMNFVSFPEGVNVLDIERGKLSHIRKEPWQTDTSIGKNSWGYTTSWESKSANSLIDDLIDIVSKNGNLLLNVGPKSDGTIPNDQVAVLLEIGKWLEINGEAIYRTRPWKLFGEGPSIVQNGHYSETTDSAFTANDIRFTTKKNTLYVIFLDKPQSNTITIRSLSDTTLFNPKRVKSVELLETSEQLKWNANNDAFVVSLTQMPVSEYAFVLKIKLSKQ